MWVLVGFISNRSLNNIFSVYTYFILLFLLYLFDYSPAGKLVFKSQNIGWVTSYSNFILPKWNPVSRSLFLFHFVSGMVQEPKFLFALCSLRLMIDNNYKVYFIFINQSRHVLNSSFFISRFWIFYHTTFKTSLSLY
jgi:hypothetical protein